jgi:hypothetical protein
MNNIGSSQENKGVVENISKSIEEYVSSTKDSIVNNPVVNKGSQVFNSSSQLVSSAVNNINMQNAKEVMMDTVTNSSSSIYFIIFLLVLAGIVCYIIYYIIVDNVIYQKRILLPGTETPLLCTKYSKLPFSDILDSGNGNKRSYCFWIYILDIQSQGGEYRHIATVTDKKNKNADIHKSSLSIRVNRNKNSIEFRFGTNNSNPSSLAYNESNTSSFLTTDIQVGSTPVKYLCGVEIKYVPIQRWVHVGIVINDNGGGSITTYIDGNFVETLNNKNVKEQTYSSGAQIDTNRLNLEHIGTLYVGGLETPPVDIPMGFSGLFSRFTIFNYDLNRNDIYKEYSSGPIKGGLSSIGLTAYGLRNPVYKLNNTEPVVYY